MMNTTEAALQSFRLKDRLLQAFRLPRAEKQEYGEAFMRSGPRLAPPPGNDQPAIDFIELRPGEIPDDALSGTGSGTMAATPFQGTPWLRSWHGSHAGRNGGTPVTAIGFSAGEPVFVLPLAITRKFGVRILSWQASAVSDYNAPILNPRHRALIGRLDGHDILREIAARLGRIDVIYVPKQPAEVAGSNNPFVLVNAGPYHARTHAVSLPSGESWDSFFQRRRSGKTRRRLREKLSALEKSGDVEFAFAQTREEARAIAARCLAAKTRQLREQGYWDPFGEPNLRDFVIDHFASHIGSSTWACRYSVGGELTATAIGFRSSQEWLLYQMALEDTDKARHSPGTHMLLGLMKHCMEQKVARLDLSLGDERYKTEWCDVHSDLVISSLSLTPMGKLVERVLRARDALRARLASDPAHYERAKRIRGMAKKLRLPF